ncbi:MAG: AMP-binding protein [Candidatus Omnitrophica bacterium]|nr:AMP-binding protein [Candidatus Omnitrophota bacterium]
MNRPDNLLSRPWKELKRLQDRRLHHFLTRHLYPFSPYYRQLFDRNNIRPDQICTTEDLTRLPFTSKNDFLDLMEKDPAKANLEFCLQPNEEAIKKYLPKPELIKFALLTIFRGKGYLKERLEKEYRPIFLTATAGTTNRPIPFLYTSYDLENLKKHGIRLLEIIGIKRDETAVSVFPYAPHLAFWLTVFGGVAANVFILSTGGGKTLGTEGNIRSILRVKPHFLIGVPSYVYHILKVAREESLDLSFLNRVILGAGRVPEGFKLKIAKLLNEMGSSDVKVLGTYGFTESRSAWVECPTDIAVSSGYHTYPDKEVFEIVDPDTGEVKKEGEDGEIVYTGIDSRGTCVLRYRTGDLARGGIVYSPCPHCGRTVPRISSDIIRTSNIKNIQLSKIKGSLVNLDDLGHLLDDKEEIDEWQIEIVKKDNDPYEVDELILYISLLKDVDKEEFSKRLNDEVLSSADVSFNKINYISRKEIQQRIEIESAVKAKKIIDKRPVV